MARLNQIAPDAATGKAHELLAAVRRKLGIVPNLMRALANSPAALEGYLALSGSLGEGALSAGDRERIALAVAQTNECDYCLAAHSALGRMAGLSIDQVRDSRLGLATGDPKAEALLRFTRKVVSTRGKVSDADLADVREHGYSEGAIAEVVAHVAVNVLTNYFNNVAQTDVDFPKAAELPSS